MNSRIKNMMDLRHKRLVRFRRISVIFIIIMFNVAVASAAAILDDFPVPEGSERIFLSLRVISEHVTESITSGNSISQDCRNLARIGYIEGYIIDDGDPKDIILFGLSTRNRPSIKLDDLIVNMRGISNGIGYFPYCSLDPKPENIRALEKLFRTTKGFQSATEMAGFFEKLKKTVGPQTVVVGGVPRNSRHAHVMIDADYHMKKVSQGHVVLKGITSYLDRPLNEAAAQIKKGREVPAFGMSMARFWFHIGEKSPRFQKGTGIVALDRCNVVLLTEKQMATSSGKLVDVAGDDPHAIAFAQDMTDNLLLTAPTKVPVYADLENLFRLRALLLSMDFQSVFSSLGWDLFSFIPNYVYLDEKPMAQSMPGLANYKEWKHEVRKGNAIYTYFLVPMVCGGVDQNMMVNKNSYQNDLASELVSFRKAALLDRKSKDDLYWKMK